MSADQYKVVCDPEGSKGRAFKPWAVRFLVRGSSGYAVSRYTDKKEAERDCIRRNREIEARRIS